MLIYLLFTSSASANDGKPLSPDTKVSGILVSSHDDASTLWSNPSNLAFHPYPSRFILIGSNGTNHEFKYANKRGPLGVGVAYKSALGETLWSTSTALGLRLDDRLNFGVLYSWNAPSYQENYSTVAIGGSWRPLMWLGFGALVDQIGTPQNLNINEQLHIGTTLNLFQGQLRISGEGYSDTINFNTESIEYRSQATLQLPSSLSFETFYTTEGTIGLAFSGGLDKGTIGSRSWLENDQAFYNLQYKRNVDDRPLVSSSKNVAYFEIKDSYPYEATSSAFGGSPEETYLSLLHRVHSAAHSRSIKGLVLHLRSIPFSMAQIQEVQQALQVAQDRGKFIIVYMDEASDNRALYLASSADRIYLHPSGELDLTGLHSERIYLRSFLDHLGVEPNFVRRSEYKSAPEQFTNSESSEASKEQSAQLMDDLYESLIEGLSVGRKLPKETITTLIENGPYPSEDALNHGLIDGLYYTDQLNDVLEEHFGENYHAQRFYMPEALSDGWGAMRSVAVIQITGAITSGVSQSGGLLSGGSTGSETIVRQINEARKDDAVRAVVLRVDSPGGSAFASEKIWRAIELLKEKEKPVVVSMGGVAASGGYYVACNADAIYAEDTSITGSIGVYSGKYSVDKLLQNLSIHVEHDSRGSQGSLYTSTQSWNEDQKAKMEDLVDNTYTLFKNRVAEGRSLSLEEVEEVARGHVWSGTAAKENGLVDELGGFYDALSHAKDLANLDGFGESQIIFYKGGSSTREPIQYSLQQSSSLFQYTLEHPSFINREISHLKENILGPLSDPLLKELPPEVQVWTALQNSLKPNDVLLFTPEIPYW